MALTQDFKTQCDQLNNKWKELITKDWKTTAWEKLRDRIEGGKNAILTDPFFTSFKTKTTEEQKWMLKGIIDLYNTPEMLYSENSLHANIEDLNSKKVYLNALLFSFYEYRATFLKNVDVSKWDNTDKITQLEKDKQELTTTLKTWTDTFGDKKPSEIKTSLDNRPNITQEDYKKLQDNQEKHTAEDLEKHKIEDLKPSDLPADWKEQLATIPTLTANQKPADYEEIKNANVILKADKEKVEGERDQWKEAVNKANILISDKDQIIKGKDGEIEKLNNQIIQQANQPIPSPTQDNQYLNKLLDLYKREIKKRTELFYQDFSIDNNKINAKYGNPSISYLELLKNLKGESEPEQVINAFCVVALIVATETAQEESDKLSKLSTIPAKLKKNKLNYFQRIKDDWDLKADEPQELNNPLYLPIIKDKEKFKTQINNILTLWQNK